MTSTVAQNRFLEPLMSNLSLAMMLFNFDILLHLLVERVRDVGQAQGVLCLLDQLIVNVLLLSEGHLIQCSS